MDPKARIEKRAVYPVGRREVWAAITKPEELSRWFGSEVVALDLRPGGRIVFRDGSGESHRALVEIVEAPARFAMTSSHPIDQSTRRQASGGPQFCRLGNLEI